MPDFKERKRRMNRQSAPSLAYASGYYSTHCVIRKSLKRRAIERGIHRADSQPLVAIAVKAQFVHAVIIRLADFFLEDIRQALARVSFDAQSHGLRLVAEVVERHERCAAPVVPQSERF